MKSSRKVPGLERLHQLRGHGDVVLRLVWSPDGDLLASTSVDKSIRLWDWQSGGVGATLLGHWAGVNEVVWGPDRAWLASASFDQTIHIWNLETHQTVRELRGHSADITSLTMSPDGTLLASASADRTVGIWRTGSWERLATLEHGTGVHRVAWSNRGELASCSATETVIWAASDFTPLRRTQEWASSVAWSPNGRWLAAAREDGTIRIQDVDQTGSDLILEGHTGQVRSAVFSFDGRLLASSGMDNRVRLWRTDKWTEVASIREVASNYWPQGIAFHPTSPILATFGEYDRTITVWRIDTDRLVGLEPESERLFYKNARVVLLGDTGVGKTGLRQALMGEPIIDTGSTYGRRVWTLDITNAVEQGRREVRETLLWDMAGQPAYRLIHQLHLREVVVALVVFDARQETGDPLAAARHWGRALLQARQRDRQPDRSVRTILVLGRADVQGAPVSMERIQSLKSELAFDEFFETSAKLGWGISELAAAVKSGIAWGSLPTVSSPKLFEKLKTFLITRKKAGQVVARGKELETSFRIEHPEEVSDPQLHASFEVCVSRLQNSDLIRRLSYDGQILLQPELLDSYASAIVLAAQEAAKTGPAAVAEEDILAGRFRMPKSERVPDAADERLLLTATIEEMLEHQLVLREDTVDGRYVVFPALFLQDWPAESDPPAKAVIIRFRGPVQNIYGTLTVLLAHSGIFQTSKASMWRNAAIFDAKTGGECGLHLRDFGDGAGELGLFFRSRDGESAPSTETRVQFEGFVMSHLRKSVLNGSLSLERQFLCGSCGTPVHSAHVKILRAKGRPAFDCPCGNAVSILEPEDQIRIEREAVSRLVSVAEKESKRAVSGFVIGAKEKTGKYDVFVSYNSRDRESVMEIARRLREEFKIRPWVDESLEPGELWLPRIEEVIGETRVAAVFIGPTGMGDYQQQERLMLIDRAVKGVMRLIPVILKGVEGEPHMPETMKNFHRVDFRNEGTDPMKSLVLGITGTRPD